MVQDRIRARAANRTRKPAADPNSIAKFHSGLRAEYVSSFPVAEDPFRTSKRDKRAIRHNALMGKVREGGIFKDRNYARRQKRRLGKELKANVADLEDALPDIGDEESIGLDGEEWEGIEDDDGDGGRVQAPAMGLARSTKRRRVKQSDGKIVMNSLQHRPGAMKRKAKMERGEMERFGKNLAQMVGNGQARVRHSGTPGIESQSSQNTHGAAAQADRWAALRRFIGGTMDKTSVFKNS